MLHRHRAGALTLVALLILGMAACEPRKPTDPKPPIPKVDFTHERSTS
jgi:hypothetical protein